jgi:hypothetical protein
MPTIKADVVVGTGATQVLVFTPLITFCPPAHKIIEERIDVTITKCVPTTDKVIFNGTMQKNIIYKEPPGQGGGGTVRFVEVIETFAGFIVIPGTLPDDQCQVEFAGVRNDNFVLNPLTRDQETGAILTAEQKAIIDVEIKVTREQQIDID